MRRSASGFFGGVPFLNRVLIADAFIIQYLCTHGGGQQNHCRTRKTGRHVRGEVRGAVFERHRGVGGGRKAHLCSQITKGGAPGVFKQELRGHR
jgi:hypothetical protein